VDKDRAHVPPPPAKRLFVAGWTAADLDCLEFVDEFFGAHYRDTVFFDKREGAVVVGVSGQCSNNGDFQRIASGKCDFEIIRSEQRYVARAYSDVGRQLAAMIPGGQAVPDSELDELIERSMRLGDDDRQVLETASQLLRAGKVPTSFWQVLADRCIACTACNLACPTCTCFDVFDLMTAENDVRRWRLWDSCQLEAFAREASGHNPMGEAHVRAHRRIHHKLVADVIRWGHITCYLCGRCDQVCPTGIGMTAVCRQIVREFGNGATRNESCERLSHPRGDGRARKNQHRYKACKDSIRE
jgi:sulfhydrogenase subunit beta (sulfur reductase)